MNFEILKREYIARQRSLQVLKRFCSAVIFNFFSFQYVLFCTNAAVFVIFSTSITLVEHTHSLPSFFYYRDCSAILGVWAATAVRPGPLSDARRYESAARFTYIQKSVARIVSSKIFAQQFAARRNSALPQPGRAALIRIGLLSASGNSLPGARIPQPKIRITGCGRQ